MIRIRLSRQLSADYEQGDLPSFMCRFEPTSLCRTGGNIADRIGRLVEESGYRCFRNNRIFAFDAPLH
jgi:hypothetical protein